MLEWQYPTRQVQKLSLIHICGVVCTALSMAGGFITDLKIGYWLGSTPAKQETWKFLGTIVSAATVGGVMIIPVSYTHLMHQ